MNIEIPHLETHKVYKNTFLQHVGVAMAFPKITPAKAGESFDKDMDLFFERFLQPLKYNHDFFEKGIFIHGGNEDQYRMEFTPEYIYAEISRTKYRSFAETVLPMIALPKVMAFSVLKLGNIRNLSIRKINIFPFGATAEALRTDSNKVYESLLSPEFNALEVKNSIKDKGYVTPVLEREFILDDYKYQFKTGIIADKKLDGRYYLMLDSSVQYAKSLKILEGSIDRRLIEENDLMYDLFHWCVTKSVIDIMDK